MFIHRCKVTAVGMEVQMFICRFLVLLIYARCKGELCIFRWIVALSFCLFSF